MRQGEMADGALANGCVDSDMRGRTLSTRAQRTFGPE